MAKIIIDIPIDLYERVKAYGVHGEYDDELKVENAFCEATVIPDGTTNGEIIKALFPNVNVYEHNGGATYSVNNEYNFNATWCDSPYKEIGHEDHN